MNASCMSEDMFAKLKHLLSIHYSRYFFIDLIENVLLVKSDICNFISVKLLCSANNNDLFCYAWSYHALINFPMFYTMLRYNFLCYANLCKFMQCNVLLCCALLCNEMITYHFLFYPIFCYIKHYSAVLMPQDCWECACVTMCRKMNGSSCKNKKNYWKSR